jgi:hypothetical protein
LCCKRGGCPAASPTLRATTRGSCAPAGVGIERAVAGGGGARRRGALTSNQEGLPPPGVAAAAPLAGIRSCAAAELVEASVLKGVDLAWARRRHRRCPGSRRPRSSDRRAAPRRRGIGPSAGRGARVAPGSCRGGALTSRSGSSAGDAAAWISQLGLARLQILSASGRWRCSPPPSATCTAPTHQAAAAFPPPRPNPRPAMATGGELRAAEIHSGSSAPPGTSAPSRSTAGAPRLLRVLQAAASRAGHGHRATASQREQGREEGGGDPRVEATVARGDAQTREIPPGMR